MSESDSEDMKEKHENFRIKFSAIWIWHVYTALYAVKKKRKKEKGSGHSLSAYYTVFSLCTRAVLSSRESLIENFCTLWLSQFSSYISLSLHCPSSVFPDLKRVIRLHGDARDKRKEGRRDTAAQKKVTGEKSSGNSHSSTESNHSTYGK